VTVQPKPISRPWCSYLRWSVRALIVLVLLIGAWLGWIVRSAHIQREAVAAITKAGGAVRYSWDSSDPRDTRSGFAQLIGPDYFGHVAAVWFDDAANTVMPEVGRLIQVAVLQLDYSDITDAGLAYLEGLTGLAVLELSDTHITDAGLAHLDRLTKLETLELDGTEVGDAGLARLTGLAQLKMLDLRHTAVTDAGLVHLKGLSGLRCLELSHTKVTDRGVQALQKALPNVQIVR
jgi:internalin A